MAYVSGGWWRSSGVSRRFTAGYPPNHHRQQRWSLLGTGI